MEPPVVAAENEQIRTKLDMDKRLFASMEPPLIAAENAVSESRASS